MMTIGDAQTKIAKAVQDIYGSDEATAISYLVLGHICGAGKAQLMANKDGILNPTEAIAVGLMIDELVKGKPLQYILGETEFYGLQFKVSPAVLIPRPETEELVEWVLNGHESETENADFEPGSAVKSHKTQSVKSVLDIGTGSGCIPIALKKYLPDAEVYGLDISAEALEIARENAALNEVDVRFFQEDILKPITLNSKITARHDVIISNPPYITETEGAAMHKNVLDYEPHAALFVPDDDPLVFYKAIADFALHHLSEKGLLFLEINESLGSETIAMLQQKGFRNHILRKDMNGKDRMIRAGLLP